MPIKKGTLPLSETHPELAKEAVGWDPLLVTAGVGKKLDWECSNKHRWTASVAHRTRGQGCPICANRQILVGFNDLATTNPALVTEVDGWEPKDFTRGSHKNMSWKCKEGHKWKTKIYQRAISGTGCPFCSNHKLLVGFNDFATTNPELIQDVISPDPKTFFAGSKTIVNWQCPLGHVWNSPAENRTLRGLGCPFCSGMRVLTGFNDLKTTHPELAKEAFGWDPEKASKGKRKKVKWKCIEGHIFEAEIANRTARGRNDSCPVCSNREVLQGFNDLASTHPELSKEASGWNPKEYVAGSEDILKWQCPDKHQWKASIASRTRNLSGCPTCAKYGFDPNADGFIYFLEQDVWKMYQIGITNYPEKRLSQHRKNDWELLEIRGPMDGHLAQQWETAILRMLKAKGADLSNSKIAGKFDGYSEAWSKATFEVKSIKQMMKLTEEFEGNK